ncbi:TWiK family of potassium channels protein 18 [Episyrphus balteatus]|uniref:TWiK family of potassium channels protein 18 n=1 Tax=Episyrphus balteatus TaxID=286459 RepID=UPI002484D995|nr:TWiK family of potassium channels protein 18 [Episyrphus balteatus]XP_055839257.1 TWiK family of potassium channels protein 18 [Episyrphus balteatus]
MSRKRSFKRREKPPFERFKDHFRAFTAFMFSNVGIILLVIIYTIGGAFMFQAIETSEANKVARKTSVGERNKTVIADLLWKITCCESNIFNETEFKKRMNETIFYFQRAVIKAELDDVDIKQQWSFSGAFLYSLTVITTIGYGNITPKSNWGKLITILYAIIGMPLFLLYLSNIGDILAKSFKWIYAKVCLCRICPGVARRRIIRERRKIRRMALERDLDSMEEGSESKSSNSSDQTSSETNDFYEEDDSEIEAEIQTNTETVTVPVTVCICIMIGYILFGAFMFGTWENWTLLDGSYFCFISLSSIGFGDIVPGEKVITNNDITNVETSFILCAVYLLLGMALIAMCFNLMQEQVIYQMRSIKRVLKICFRCKR